jgi:hypothetical protein
MIEVTIRIKDTETGEEKDFVHPYDEPPILLGIEYPSVELGLSLGTEYPSWQARFDGSDYNFLNRNMGQS